MPSIVSTLLVNAPVDEFIRKKEKKPRVTQARLRIGRGWRLWALGCIWLASSGTLRAQTITTIAGSQVKGDGRLAINANFSSPGWVSIYGPDLYISDAGNNRIRKVDASGTITSVAGNGVFGFSGDDGQATGAALSSPADITFDEAGNLYIADQGNSRIRRVGTNGIITTVVGDGSVLAGITPANVQLSGPSGIVFRSGYLYITDQGNSRVLRVSFIDNTVTTVAGNRLPGFSGDGGEATEAKLKNPSGIAFDDSGNLYIADTGNNRIRRVAPNGTITTVAGGGATSTGTTPATIQLNRPTGVVYQAGGTLVITDSDNGRVLKINLTNDTIAVIAGGGTGGGNGDGGLATRATLNNPAGVTVNGAGNFFIADYSANRIRMINADGIISTVAGSGFTDFSGDGDLAVRANLYKPAAIAFDGLGNYFIADKDNSRIRKVASTGVITTVVGGGDTPSGTTPTSVFLNGPNGLAVDGANNLYIAEQYYHRIRKVNFTDNTITTLAGNWLGEGFSGDGSQATSARMSNPRSIVFDRAGNLYIADGGNHRIRKITVNGIISTVVGGGADVAGTTPTSVQMLNPIGIAFDRRENLYIADQGNNRILKVDFTANTVARVAGGGSPPDGIGDGGLATAAALASPTGVVVDGVDNIFIADYGFNRIRRVDPNGMITTLAGDSNNGFAGDGGPASEAQLFFPYGLATDAANNLYIADRDNNRIRRVGAVKMPPVPPAIAGQTGTLGTPFTFTVPPFIHSADQQVSYVITGVPTGLTADNATRVISGTPTGLGVFSVTVVATDTGGLYATATFSVTVVCPTLRVQLTGNNIGCGLTSTTLTAIPSLVGDYTYTFGNGATQIGAANKAVGTETGTYSVTMTSVGSCTNSATASIVIGANQAVTNPTVSVSGRLSPTNASVVVQAGGGSSFELQRAVRIVAGYQISESEPSTTGRFIMTQPGQYQVTVSGGGNCQSVVTVTVLRDN